MRDDKSGKHRDKIAPFEEADAGSQQTGDEGGLGRNDEDNAARGIEK